ncbi:hypothetical protein FJT64_026658 [Amphibalanus amphitrite]|uniref:Uncharacterized protein n=1 Tax=Amphibalanus amphitrite TaxID=1232801 RepID=A0A6A4VYF6_AMPAM|nr:hypothetical protein FJT64_026658 [Amphibalanus amphitrite]
MTGIITFPKWRDFLVAQQLINDNYQTRNRQESRVLLPATVQVPADIQDFQFLPDRLKIFVTVGRGGWAAALAALPDLELQQLGVQLLPPAPVLHRPLRYSSLISAESQQTIDEIESLPDLHQLLTPSPRPLPLSPSCLPELPDLDSILGRSSSANWPEASTEPSETDSDDEYQDEEAAAFTLRMCLSEDARDKVSLLDEVNDMMDKLDEEYGDPSALTDLVMNEIKRFDMKGSRKLIDFIDVVEKAYFDLKNLNMEKEISNTTIVSIIEMKLPEDLPQGVPSVLTKRMVLGQVNSVYDTLGLASPFLIKMKVQLRNLWSEAKHLDWDDPLSDSMRDEWVSLFRELYEMEKITFPRSVKPEGAVGNPSLIMFSDGSNDAYGTCAYARWALTDDTFACRLICAKSRVAPLKRQTIVRIELCGPVLASRLAKFLQQEMEVTFETVMFLVDSEITDVEP